MRRIRVYADNSVFSGIEDEEFVEPSKRFFERVRSGDYILLVSAVTFRKLAKAPDPVRDLWQGLPPGSTEEVRERDEVIALAREYIEAGVLGQASIDDALHVAAATVAGADLILSWNFRRNRSTPALTA